MFDSTQVTGTASANPLQYTGRENDSTGVYYYRNRYYSPALRRFISADPLGEAAGENEYAYVNNSPTNATDPLGLYPGEGGGYNALNDMGVGGRAVSWYLDGDQIARDSWTLGNYCAPFSDRMWAGVRLGWTIISNVCGGKIFSKAFGLLGKGGAAIFKRIPCNNFTSRFLGKSCFVAGTLVHTKAGLKPIEQLRAKAADGTGDEVLSYNEREKRTEYKPVVETYVRQTKEIIKLEIAGEAAAIETTAEHPFYVRVHKARDGLSADDEDEIGEWREAGSLQVGDEVRQANGEWTRISAVERQARSETVYNFAVADNHNYFVGQQGTLVHNQYKIALGIDDYLDDFASKVGGETWKQWARNHTNLWQDRFLKLMNDQNTKAFFNLDGVNIWGGIQKASRGVGGATDWELLMIRQNRQWWDRITFMLDGKVVPNPFL